MMAVECNADPPLVTRSATQYASLLSEVSIQGSLAEPMVRAAILGLGRWGRSLVNSVQGKSRDITFVAAHARPRATVEDFCRDKGLAFVDSYAKILADPAIDAVVLATPHSQHGEQVRQAAAAGKHIFVEKPMTLELASAR